MIKLIACLMGTFPASSATYGQDLTTEYVTVIPTAEGLRDLGSLKHVYCQDQMTTKSVCSSYNVGTFTSHESQTDYSVCFKSNKMFDHILRADEDIRLIKLNGNYFIMGEAIHACDNGQRNIREAAPINITDCNAD